MARGLLTPDCLSTTLSRRLGAKGILYCGAMCNGKVKTNGISRAVAGVGERQGSDLWLATRALIESVARLSLVPLRPRYCLANLARRLGTMYR